MKRSEQGAILTVAIVATAVVVTIAIWGTTLADATWSNGGSNLLGLIVGPSLVVGLGMALWTRWTHRCAMPLCVRQGEHPVQGTLRAVCTHHHTRTHHERVHDLLGQAHRESDKLGWGQSHDC